MQLCASCWFLPGPWDVTLAKTLVTSWELALQKPNFNKLHFAFKKAYKQLKLLFSVGQVVYWDGHAMGTDLLTLDCKERNTSTFVDQTHIMHPFTLSGFR